MNKKGATILFMSEKDLFAITDRIENMDKDEVIYAKKT